MVSYGVLIFKNKLRVRKFCWYVEGKSIYLQVFVVLRQLILYIFICMWSNFIGLFGNYYVQCEFDDYCNVIKLRMKVKC